MENNDIIEIKNLDDDNLLSLYDMVVSHLQYLRDNLIDTTVNDSDDDGGESNEK